LIKDQSKLPIGRLLVCRASEGDFAERAAGVIESGLDELRDGEAEIFARRSRPDDGTMVAVGDVSLWYHDSGGDGEPIVLVGGFTAGHFAFDFSRPHLADYRLITWEPRGLGRSDCPAGAAYSAAVWADDLAGLLDALEIERTHVWAAGFGSYIALRLAAQYPTRVGSLVTYTDVWAGDPAKGYARIWEVYSAIVRNFGTTGFGARVLANVFDVSDLPWFGRWEARNIEEVLHSKTVERTVGYGLLRADVRDDLARITRPTLVLQGGRTWDGSVLDPADDASLQLMRTRIANLRDLTIPDAHPGYVLVQKPRECAAAVRDFVSQYSLTKE
jgi:pimeloyl-ACP methyl ester carboxylesterase